jgi:hypothetical protein
MRYRSPSERANRLLGLLEKLAPLWPLMEASGATLDARELIDLLSDNFDQPEIARVITFLDQQQMGPGGPSHDATQSPVTRRENVRRNIPTGGTQESRSNIMQQVLRGGGQANGQQMASMARPPA